MPDPLTWELRFANEFSAAARQATNDMRALAAEARAAGIELSKLTGAEEKEAAAAKKSKEEHKGFFGDMFEADLLAERFNHLIDRVEEYGKQIAEAAMEATDLDYKAQVALTHLTGSSEVAEDIMAHARAFANGVGEDVDKVYQIFERLAATGLRGNQLTAAADAVRDLSIVTGRSFDQTSELFELIGSDRGIGGRAVNQLAQFPGLLNELEKHFGFVPGAANSFKQLREQLDAAPVKGAQGLALLEDMIAKVAHENQLGDVGVEASETFEGSFTKIKNDWKEVLGDMTHDPLFKELRQSLSAIADYFDPAAEGGQRMRQALNGIEVPLANIFKLVSEHPGIIAGIFESALIPIKALELGLEGVLFMIKEIQHAGSYLGALLETKSFKKAHDLVYEAESAEEQKSANDARNQRDLGLTPAERKEQEEALSIPIPGPHVLPKLEPIPGAAEGTTVTSPTLMWVGEGGETEHVIPDSKLDAAGGGGGAPVINISVSVAGGGGNMTEQDLAAKIAEVVPSALMNALEQIAQQKGGG